MFNYSPDDVPARQSDPASEFLGVVPDPGGFEVPRETRKPKRRYAPKKAKAKRKKAPW